MKSSNQVPDRDTLGRFCNLRNGLQEKLFAQVVGLLQKKGLIAAPSSTENRDKQRDPDAQKGNEWLSGYKAHVGADKDSGLVHKLTAANVHNVSVLEAKNRPMVTAAILAPKSVRAPLCATNKAKRCRPAQLRSLSLSGQYAAKRAEHKKSFVRAKVEHVFGAVKGYPSNIGFRLSIRTSLFK